MTGDDPATQVEATLRSYGISVETIDGGEPLDLTYMTAFPGREIHRREIGRALNALIDRAEANAWDPVRVEATVVRSPGDPLGTWRAKAAWFERLIDDELTETEFSTRVLETVRHADPEGDASGTDEPATDTDEPATDTDEPASDTDDTEDTDEPATDDAGGTNP